MAAIHYMVLTRCRASSGPPCRSGRATRASRSTPRRTRSVLLRRPFILFALFASASRATSTSRRWRHAPRIDAMPHAGLPTASWFNTASSGLGAETSLPHVRLSGRAAATAAGTAAATPSLITRSSTHTLIGRASGRWAAASAQASGARRTLRRARRPRPSRRRRAPRPDYIRSQRRRRPYAASPPGTGRRRAR